MVIRAVIDTSSLVPSTKRRTLQELAQQGLYVAVWSPWIVAELNRVLAWYWLRTVRPDDLSLASERACSSAAHRMMEILFATFTLVHPEPPYPPAWPTLRDVWDLPIWAAAKLTNARCVVSENTRDFPPIDDTGRHMYEGIEYLTVDAFIALLTGDVE